jgi:hypothetical protein
VQECGFDDSTEGAVAEAGASTLVHLLYLDTPFTVLPCVTSQTKQNKTNMQRALKGIFDLTHRSCFLFRPLQPIIPQGLSPNQHGMEPDAAERGARAGHSL